MKDFAAVGVFLTTLVAMAIVWGLILPDVSPLLFVLVALAAYAIAVLLDLLPPGRGFFSGPESVPERIALPKRTESWDEVEIGGHLSARDAWTKSTVAVAAAVVLLLSVGSLGVARSLIGEGDGTSRVLTMGSVSETPTAESHTRTTSAETPELIATATLPASPEPTTTPVPSATPEPTVPTPTAPPEPAVPMPTATPEPTVPTPTATPTSAPIATPTPIPPPPTPQVPASPFAYCTHLHGSAYSCGPQPWRVICSPAGYFFDPDGIVPRPIPTEWEGWSETTLTERLEYIHRAC